MRQYALSFSQPADYSEGNFFVSGCNTLAFQQVKKWPAWQSLLLSGPAGSGKTHLGLLWAARANAQVIPCKTETLDPQRLAMHALIEDMEHAKPENLLHVINLAKEQNVSLLLTSALPAKQLAFTLPDLTSRLAAMPAATINKPDDEALMGVMRKQFADRQIGASEEVVHYLLTHGERSFSSVAATVAFLDKAMWQEKKNLTIPFIRKILMEDTSGVAT